MPKSFLYNTDYPFGLQNNNPGNIRTGDSWQGMIGSNSGFVVFADISWGIRALGIDLTTKINEGYNTIREIINRYAPWGDGNNDPDAYIAQVVNTTGIDADQILTADGNTLKKLARGIINQEQGYYYSNMLTDGDIIEGLSLIGGINLTPASAAGATLLLVASIAYAFRKQLRIA